jgi:hypothetical protein
MPGRLLVTLLAVATRQRLEVEIFCRDSTVGVGNLRDKPALRTFTVVRHCARRKVLGALLAPGHDYSALRRTRSLMGVEPNLKASRIDRSR